MSDNIQYVGTQDANSISNNCNKQKIKRQYINNINEGYVSAEYEFAIDGDYNILTLYRKYFFIAFIFFGCIFFINLWYLQYLGITLFSAVFAMVAFALFIHFDIKNDQLNTKGYTFTNSYDYIEKIDNEILKIKAIGTCPVKGCNHELNIAKPYNNLEGYDRVIACRNHPQHLFRFNVDDDSICVGELIAPTPIVVRNG
ncbi:hypothetical protein [Francisella philomiragia]|uniref:Uncharacterized protein n=1 Tax=Francisella philomiragia TaxID=28110 RepID=A0ABS1GAF7_9GAMM|nr:hypothetical protein [Francisella philomiragia]MBK2258412.1 hypothetical protein [Francisella philomiragia]MBK2301790.1 hypothetical protein [Francisella philomiragia]